MAQICNRLQLAGVCIAATVACVSFTGCQGMSSPAGALRQPVTLSSVHGRAMGGQQPVTGASVVLYAVGTGGQGTGAVALTTAVQTDAHGGFTLPSYSCHNINDVYIVAQGGDAGAGTNPAIAEMAALGACTSLNASTFINLNEVTTVAAVAALYRYMDRTNASPETTLAYDGTSGGLTGLQSAFANAAAFANYSSGLSPGSVPAGATVPTSLIYTLANVIASCINSQVTSGASTQCSNLFGLTTPPPGPAPANTVGALTELAFYPSLNTSGVFATAAPVSPFEPQLAAAPADFWVGLGSPACSYTSIDAQHTKPKLTGLVAQGDNNFYNKSYVGRPENSLSQLTFYNDATFAILGIYVFWSDIEPQQGVFDYTQIDNALQKVCNYNLTHTPVAVRLKVIHASDVNSVNAQPYWALTLGATAGGTGIDAVYPPRATEPLRIGAWWTPQYSAAWNAMQAALGQRYDTNLLVNQSEVATCASIDEETWLSPADTASLTQMYSYSPPYSDAAQLACLNAAPPPIAAAWPNTWIFENYSAFRRQDGFANSSQYPVVDPSPTTAQELTYVNPANTSTYIPRLMLGQTALSGTTMPTNDSAYLQPFVTYGAQTGTTFQPDGPNSTYSAVCADVANGLSTFHELEMEVNQSEEKAITPTQMSAIAQLQLPPHTPCP